MAGKTKKSKKKYQRAKKYKRIESIVRSELEKRGYSKKNAKRIAREVAKRYMKK